jgi:hypothetical protein
LYVVISGGTSLTWIHRTQQVRKLVPEKNLGYFTLEDGFGWEQICPHLGKPIPDQHYPRGNAPKEFEALTMSLLGPSFKKAAAIVITTVLVPVIGLGAWIYGS